MYRQAVARPDAPRRPPGRPLPHSSRRLQPPPRLPPQLWPRHRLYPLERLGRRHRRSEPPAPFAARARQWRALRPSEPRPQRPKRSARPTWPPLRLCRPDRRIASAAPGHRRPPFRRPARSSTPPASRRRSPGRRQRRNWRNPWPAWLDPPAAPLRRRAQRRRPRAPRWPASRPLRPWRLRS